ncbi:iron complex transport system permease protein [Tamaricihabitans halophyticus]|uniref:Iron complex transport system permease protein n=1 Tax=Tamaricihabitans halophyticus TaxID=1262583 RepID=A0A4R2R3C5_9PSEU|nr:iron chelate uptake ABC transporter family permease subunit [Tamaricihabitans halophyticus]TCP57310.1 iron complex transport system permease protein [Tamaricihabitans halophyticus]
MKLRAGAVALGVRNRAVLVVLGMLVAWLVLAVFAIGTGDFQLSPGGVLRTLAGDGSRAEYLIVVEQRLPRLLVATMVGAALGISGAVFQSLTRNPLGSPDIIGFTAGSATGGIVVILVFGGGQLPTALGSVISGALTAVAIYLLCGKDGLGGYRMVLLGVGLGVVLTGLNSYLLTRVMVEDAAQAVTWLVGNLAGRGWESVGPLAVVLVLLTPVFLVHSPGLRLLESGEQVAAGLGVAVTRVRLVLVLSSVALVAVAVAAAGPIAFVALAAPQLARRMTASPGPNLFPAAVTGALLVVLADFLGQRLLSSSLLPVGVVTGALGGIYLAWLLLMERAKNKV